MKKLFQIIFIQALLCSSLLGEEPDYGVKKWPTLLGSLEWGMKTLDARSVMKKKGFKFLKEIDATPKKGDFFYHDEFVEFANYYRGRFAGSDAVVELVLINGQLASMAIYLGLIEDDLSYAKKPRFLRPHTRPLQSALKLRDAMVKRYGEPSDEVFFQLEKAKDKSDFLTQKMRDKGQKVSKNKALSEKYKDIFYQVEYETKDHDVSYWEGSQTGATITWDRVTKKDKVPYMEIESSNYGTLVISAKGPLGVKFFIGFRWSEN